MITFHQKNCLILFTSSCSTINNENGGIIEEEKIRKIAATMWLSVIRQQSFAWMHYRLASQFISNPNSDLSKTIVPVVPHHLLLYCILLQ